tara:strand:- start:172 stop:552 length:381 start_codon:yes stop_codon:yes gene_type:complete
MKTEKSIQHKIKQVKFRVMKKAIRNGLSKKPCNCKHSGLVRGSASDPLFYVCLLDADRPQEWEGTICDPSVPNTCPFFKNNKTKEQIESEIEDMLSSGDMGAIASKYPDIAALLWVLAGTDEDEDT